MKMLALVVALVLLAVPVASAETFSRDSVRFERVERIMTARSIFTNGSETPRVTFSESLVLAGHEAACTFTVECNNDGTFDATFQGCSISQARKIFEAAADIC